MGTLTTDRPKLAVDHYLRGLLADGPVRAIDAIAEAEANGFSRSSTVRSRRRIGALIRRVGFGPGSYVEWSLPPAVHTDLQTWKEP
jgi:hypothetical protein